MSCAFLQDINLCMYYFDKRNNIIFIGEYVPCAMRAKFICLFFGEGTKKLYFKLGINFIQ